MTPTCKLRLVRRNTGSSIGKTEHGDLVYPHEREILQQWWIDGLVNIGFGEIETGKGEWRDVVTEDE